MTILKQFQNKWLTWWVVPLIVFLAIIPQFVPIHWTFILTEILVMALFATSLNIQVGYAGMGALGHATFLGLGCYSFTLLVLKGALPIPISFIFALLITIVISAIIGYFCLRGGTLNFALLHLGFNMLIYTVVYKWSWAGGEMGFINLPRPEIFSSGQGYFYFVLLMVIICLILLRIMERSSFFKVVQGLRQNDERLRFLGINTRNFQLIVFIISSLFAAVAGILYAMLYRSVSPSFVDINLSASGLMMCLLGGMGTFMGPSLGAVIAVILSSVVSSYITQWQGLMGVIMIACILAFRGGILGGQTSKIKFLSKKFVKLSRDKVVQ